MRRVINGRRNSIMHTVSILAIEGDEIAALSRPTNRRAGADATTGARPKRSSCNAGTDRAATQYDDAPVTTRSVGDQWRIETYRLPNKAALDAFRERPDDPVARAGAGPECSFALTMDVCHSALGANEHG
jgi:hypothetical protein